MSRSTATRLALAVRFTSAAVATDAELQASFGETPAARSRSRSLLELQVQLPRIGGFAFTLSPPARDFVVVHRLLTLPAGDVAFRV